MTELQELASDILRRRSGWDGPLLALNDVIGELRFLRYYGLVPTIDTLSDLLYLVPRDGKSRRVQLVPCRDEFQVKSDHIEGDILAFIRYKSGKIVGGWTTSNQAQEAPVVGGQYVLEEFNLRSFPKDKDFVFNPPCNDPCYNASVWDYEKQGWECFWCPIIRLDSKARKNF